MSAPSHPVLRTLVELHFEVRSGLAQVLIWRDADGTEAVVLGRRLFAAVAGGPVYEASAAVLARQRGGVAALRRVVRRLVGLPQRTGVALHEPCADTDRPATREEVTAVLDLLREVTKDDTTPTVAAHATEWAARFALDPPAVSTLRALLSDLRVHRGPFDTATHEAIARLRAQLARGELEPPLHGSSAIRPQRQRSTP